MKDIFVKYKSPVAVLICFILAAGVFSYTKMQTGLFPNITFPKIKVIADNGQQPVNKMMVTVTRPLEEAIKRVPNLETVRSITSQGSCEISAFLNWNSNLDISKTQIESRIQEILNTLPPNTSITIEKMNPSILPVIGYSLENPNLNKIELRTLAEYTIKPYLSQTPGVSAVETIGGKIKEYQIHLNQVKLSELGLTPDTIATVLDQNNFIQANGSVVDFNRLYLSVTHASIDNLEELKNLVVYNRADRILHLRDIAEVTIGEQKQYIRINANGKDVPLIAILKQPNANLISVSEAVKKKVADMQKILPKGTVLKTFYNQSNFVGDSVKSITDVLWIGLFLAIVTAIIFLRSFKASAVLLITIPTTLALTVVALYGFGYTLNIMTLGAIAASIGLVIDDGIVVVEQIHRTHEENPKEPTKKLIGKAIHYLFPAMVGSSLSTIVIFVPFILMSGVAGAYFGVLTISMIITLVCSFFVSWLCLPVIYLLISKIRKKKKSDKKKEDHEPKQRKWVGYFIHKPAFSIGFMVLLALSITLIYPQLGTGFLPEMDEGTIVLDFNSPPGTSLDETDRMLRQVDQIIQNTPEVDSYSRRTGTQLGFFITEPNRGDYQIRLKKKRSKTTTQVSDEIRQQIEAKIPALTVDFGQVISDMLGDLMSSVQPIRIKIFGSDISKLHELGKEVAGQVEKVKGTADVFDGIVTAGPIIQVEPKKNMLAQYGITLQNFQGQIQMATDGKVVGTILESEKETNIRILPAVSQKESVENLRSSQLIAPGGHLLPLSLLANVTLKTGEAEIERENLQSLVPVTARLNGRDLGSVMGDIKKAVSANIALPQGYEIVYGGSYAQQQQSFHELLLILITAALLVFTLILFLFRDLRAALVILLVAILGVAGSFVALISTGTPLNVGSYTGVIMIIGIIGENAIFTFLQYKSSLEKLGRDDAIVFSISTRLRPNLMTAFGAIVALMPLALGIGTGAELHQPLAIAVIGGFLVAMPLLLIVLPSMIRLFSKDVKPEIEEAA